MSEQPAQNIEETPIVGEAAVDAPKGETTAASQVATQTSEAPEAKEKWYRKCCGPLFRKKKPKEGEEGTAPAAAAPANGTGNGQVITAADEELGTATAAPVEPQSQVEEPAGAEKPAPETEAQAKAEEPQAPAAEASKTGEAAAEEPAEASPEKKKSLLKRAKEAVFGNKKEKNETGAAAGGPSPADADARAQAQAIGSPENIMAAAEDDARTRKVGRARNSFISRGEDVDDEMDEVEEENKRAAEIAARKAAKSQPQ